MSGSRVGRPWPWLVACHWTQLASHAFRSPSQLCKRWQAAGAPPFETLFVLTVWRAVRCRLIGARDLIIDSAPILAWRRSDPDAAAGHAPAHHPRPLLRGYRVHTLLCRGSGLPLHFLVSPTNVHDSPFARPLLQTALRLYHLDPLRLGSGGSHPLESQTPKEPLPPASCRDRRRTGQTHQH
jgi:DDE family transposase